MREDIYDFEVGKKGQEGLDILDIMFNPHTKRCLEHAGLKPGMRVLDIGCGRGAMSLWLAQKVGVTGNVIAIDNSENQINATIDLTKAQAPKWLHFKVHSAYDIEKLTESVDFVYCRFILHHLNNPTQVIEKVYELLPKGGIFVAEEGVVSAAFTYPKVAAWGQERTDARYPHDTEGEDRDGNFGMKLHHQMKQTGFEIHYADLYQPLLYTNEQKQLLGGPAREGYKQYALAHGISEKEWEKNAKELDNLIANPAGVIGFYQSCLVVGRK
ncbi:MAG: methyltransferase domain-containing protein [Proteobacteria bacterium]|nr:methyltransferase domain-containing protein [Pseudomonadota bacterium]